VALSLNQTAAVAAFAEPGMRVASFGYPDVIAPEAMLRRILGDAYDALRYRDDSEDICRRHGMKNRPVPYAESFFALLKMELDVYDIVAERGGEILCDLNKPMIHVEPYDMVLDVGTAEHCFNIAQAAFNMAGCVKVGGHIIHENPFNAGNHGFYNLNPTWYADFYAANGFQLIDCRLAWRDGKSAPVSPTARFRYTEQEANVFAIARRREMVDFRYPVQTKYAGTIPAPAAMVLGEKEMSYG
jgi:hypothetical protein